MQGNKCTGQFTTHLLCSCAVHLQCHCLLASGALFVFEGLAEICLHRPIRSQDLISQQSLRSPVVQTMTLLQNHWHFGNHALYRPVGVHLLPSTVLWPQSAVWSWQGGQDGLVLEECNKLIDQPSCSQKDAAPVGHCSQPGLLHHARLQWQSGFEWMIVSSTGACPPWTAQCAAA